MEEEDVKYILVSGGVISGVGKGVITSSIGTLLKSLGMRVTAIKIDPYLNIDAGTFSPYEHGKCVCFASFVACIHLHCSQVVLFLTHFGGDGFCMQITPFELNS